MTTAVQNQSSTPSKAQDRGKPQAKGKTGVTEEEKSKFAALIRKPGEGCDDDSLGEKPRHDKFDNKDTGAVKEHKFQGISEGMDDKNAPESKTQLESKTTKRSKGYEESQTLLAGSEATPIATAFQPLAGPAQAPVAVRSAEFKPSASQTKAIETIEKLINHTIEQISVEKAQGASLGKVELKLQNHILPDTTITVSRGTDGTLQVQFVTSSDAALATIAQSQSELVERLKKTSGEVKVTINGASAAKDKPRNLADRGFRQARGGR